MQSMAVQLCLSEEIHWKKQKKRAAREKSRAALFFTDRITEQRLLLSDMHPRMHRSLRRYLHR